jgi:hypothetical protein
LFVEFAEEVFQDLATLKRLQAVESSTVNTQIVSSAAPPAEVPNTEYIFFLEMKQG